jgi:predicted DNA-binding ribbon-helix-helix protein
MEVTVRKNFVFDENIAMYLEEIAKDAKQSMTSLVQEMIEERYKQIKVKK